MEHVENYFKTSNLKKMKITRLNQSAAVLLFAALLFSSCSKDKDTEPDAVQQGTRERSFDLYVERIQAYNWTEAKSEYEGVKAGDKVGTLKFIPAAEDENYWYNHQFDLVGDYQSKWENERYNLSLLRMYTFRFSTLNANLWAKQFHTEEEAETSIDEMDFEIKVSIAKVPLNDAEVTVFAYLRAEEK